MDKSIKKEKRAFTFAELMISLIVISVLSAILYPTIAQFTPNANKPLFKSAYKAFSTILSEIIEDDPNGELPTVAPEGSTTGKEFCMLFCQKANVAFSKKNSTDYNDTCSDECASVYNHKVANTLTTSNGMRWKFNDYGVHTNPAPQNGGTTRTDIQNEAKTNISTFQVFVDVNSSNNKLSQLGVDCGSAIRTIATGEDVDIDRLFTDNCACTREGGCGVFYFDNTIGGEIDDNQEVAVTPSTNGIYITIPNFSGVNNQQAVYFRERLKTQDTFEILIDKKGKIVAMSPAAWGDLEDKEGD